MIFLDTGAWIALSDKSDRFHQKAVKIYSNLKNRKERFVTSDYVMDETLTRLRYDAGYEIAVRFLDAAVQSHESGILSVIRIDDILFQKAASIFRKYDTAVLSFTDCTSFAFCREYGIHQAFAFDSHFSMMGISLISSGEKNTDC